MQHSLLFLLLLGCLLVLGRTEKENKRIAICFYGKFGNLEGKGRGDSEVEALYISYLSLKNHVIDVVLGSSSSSSSETEEAKGRSLGIFAHSWEAGHIGLISAFHQLYDPWLKLYQHDNIIVDLPAFRSVSKSMMRSIALMLEYDKLSPTQKLASPSNSVVVSEKLLENPKPYNSSYDIVMLMRYDLFFRVPFRLHEMSPSHLWTATWCNNPLDLSHHNGQVVLTMEMYKGSYKRFNPDEHDKTVRNNFLARDEFLISSPANFIDFFKHSGGISYHRPAPRFKDGISSHNFIWLRADYLQWAEQGVLQEVPGMVAHVHFSITRYCIINPYNPHSREPLDLDDFQVCDASFEVLFEMDSIELVCPGYEEGVEMAREMDERFHNKTRSTGDDDDGSGSSGRHKRRKMSRRDE